MLAAVFHLNQRVAHPSARSHATDNKCREHGNRNANGDLLGRAILHSIHGDAGNLEFPVLPGKFNAKIC